MAETPNTHKSEIDALKRKTKPPNSPEDAEILLRVMTEYKTQSRQTEDQRAAITGFVVLIASAIQGALTQTGFHKNALPLTLMLIVLGLFGSLATLKLHEKSRLFDKYSNRIIKRLEELYPNTQVGKVLDSVYIEHTKRKIVALFNTRIRTFSIWLGLDILITILGVIYTITILVS